MLNYKEFMEALKQTIYSQTGWNSDCMGSLTDEGPTSDTALEIHYMNTDRDASVISIRVPELYARYQIGESITSIADSVIGTICEDDRFCLAQAVSQCKNYELAKEHLFISAESIHNEEALTQCIYQTVGDIAICPNLKLLDRNGKMIGLKVAPEFLKLWKTDENEVIKEAVRNSSKLYLLLPISPDVQTLVLSKHPAFYSNCSYSSVHKLIYHIMYGSPTNPL